MAKANEGVTGKYPLVPPTYPVGDNNGYPDPKPNTQTQKKRGCGAATKGCMYSKNSN